MNTDNTPTHAPDSDLPVTSTVGKTLMRDANHDLLRIPLSKCEDVETLRAKAEALWSLLDDIDTACDMLKPADEAGYRKFYKYTMRKVGLRQAILPSDGYDLFLPSPTTQEQ